MKWTTESFSAKVERLGRWRLWFAWYPVRITMDIAKDDGRHVWIWLEQVERRTFMGDGGLGNFWKHEYRSRTHG